MNAVTLEEDFNKSSQTQDFSVHNEFIKRLLVSNEPEVLHFHWKILKETINEKLYIRIRAAFVKRGDAAKSFLIHQIAKESDSKLIGDGLQILGHLRVTDALPLARKYLFSADNYLRYNGMIVLGWMGEPCKPPPISARYY